ncbi:MAG: DUF4199 domain-containing protein [Rikenellaceae bacterium]|nr:DUF4199 domain-containing protein [Rikenellaceae bacterium]
MQKSDFWTNAAKEGGVVGVLLAASMLFENYAFLSGSVGLMGLMMVEWIAVVVLHYWLLHRYTKRYGQQFPVEEGFPFGRAYSYVLILSIFAGVILGLVQAIYLHGIIGYEEYMTNYVNSIQELVSNSAASAQMAPMMKQMMAQLEAASTPSVLQTAWGAVTNSVLFGGLFGLIIAAVVSRNARPFAPKEEE